MLLDQKKAVGQTKKKEYRIFYLTIQYWILDLLLDHLKNLFLDPKKM